MISAQEDQDLFDRDLSNFTKFAPLDHRFQGANFRNLMRQLYSLKRVTSLWTLDDDDEYHVILYVRPDLKLLDDVNITSFVALGDDDILTPYWHQYTGLNDRLLAGRPRAATKVATRIDLTWNYAHHRGYMRSEYFLKWVVVDHYHLQPIPWNLRAQRVRATGHVADNDVCLPWCSLEKRGVCRGDCRRALPPDVAPPPRPEWADRQRDRDRLAGRISRRRRI